MEPCSPVLKKMPTLAIATFAFRPVQIILMSVFFVCHLVLTVNNPGAHGWLALGYITSLASLAVDVNEIWLFMRKEHLIVHSPRYHFLWSGVDLVLAIMWALTLVVTHPGGHGTIFDKNDQVPIGGGTAAANIAEFLSA